MVHFIVKKFWIILVLVASIDLYLASLTIVINDPNFTYRWVAFWLHIAAVLIIVVLYLKQHIDKKLFHKIFKRKDLLAFGIILSVIIFISLLFITVYPFVSVGDEVRDGGLNAMQIATGTLTNIFAYGAYDAHGL